MPTKTNHTLKNSFYFITITCYKWYSLLKSADVYDYFPTWVTHLTKGGVLVCGFVFMPNHLHLLVFVSSSNANLNTLIGNSKRFLAYEIVKRLKEKRKTVVLEKLRQGVRPEEQQKGKKHQVFQPSFDAKEVQGEDEIVRVLDYMHHNPVSKKWRLVHDFLYYPYSSAIYYKNRQQAYISVVDYRDVWEYQASASSKE